MYVQMYNFEENDRNYVSMENYLMVKFQFNISLSLSLYIYIYVCVCVWVSVKMNLILYRALGLKKKLDIRMKWT